MRKSYVSFMVVALGLMAGRTNATPISFAGSGTNPVTGSSLSASVRFDTSGTSLIVAPARVGVKPSRADYAMV
jgi:hypothetical protein